MKNINLILVNKEKLTVSNVSEESVLVSESWFSNADPENVLVVVTENTGKRTRIKRKDVLFMEVEFIKGEYK